MEELSLFDVLHHEYKWEKKDFGYDGPYPPYVRIGVKMYLLPPSLEPAFEKWYGALGVFRAKLLIHELLGKFRYIRLTDEAVEDGIGLKYVGGFDNSIPFQIMSLNKTEMILRHPEEMESLPFWYPILSPASKVMLSR